MDKAGIPRDLQLRDLRRTVNQEWRDMGVPPEQRVAALTHKLETGMKLQETYSASTAKLAKAAQMTRRAANKR